MPFMRPTLPQLIDRDAADIESRLPTVDARLRRSILGVLARMHAGSVHGLYGYLDYISKQVMIDTADETYLTRHAAIWGIARKAAAPAKGNAIFTGTTGVTVPAGTALQRSDGTEFTTDVDGTLAAGTVTVAVTATVGAAASNTAANTSLQLVSPIAGVTSSATVDSLGLTGGTDIETLDAWRARLLERVQRPPHAGTSDDYIAWALEVAGVTRAWCYPLEGGNGTVTVRFVRDNDASLIPDATEVTTVQNYIAAKKPIGATLTVAAPVAAPLNFSITLTPSTQAVKDAVTAELQDMLLRDAQPGGTILLSHINEAISIATGETDHVLTAPTADVTHTVGQLATMGTITWA